MIKLENVKLSYCHLTEPTIDKLSNKEVYKVRVDVPFSKEVYEKIVKEIADTLQYAADHKIKDNLSRNGKVPAPQHVYDVQRKISEDRKWILLDMNVARPIEVYNRFGEIQKSCPIRKANIADVQLFAYAWVHGNSWGVKLCPKAICIREDIETLLRRDEDPNGRNAGCEFSFDPKDNVNGDFAF